MKPVYIIFLLLLILISYLLFKTILSPQSQQSKILPTASPTATQSPNITPSIPPRETPQTNQICIQVITPAIDPTTGLCKEFPTPCDVPKGWKKVSNCPK